MPRKIDLDARLATARAEAAKEPPAPITWRGRDWVLPADLPVEFLEASDARRLTDALVALLGDDVRQLRPRVGIDESLALVAAASEAYGMTMGESQASA